MMGCTGQKWLSSWQRESHLSFDLGAFLTLAGMSLMDASPAAAMLPLGDVTNTDELAGTEKPTPMSAGSTQGQITAVSSPQSWCITAVTASRQPPLLLPSNASQDLPNCPPASAAY